MYLLLLAQTNVLVNDNYGVLLSDFGFTLHYLALAFRGAIGGSYIADIVPRWYAPEYWKPFPEDCDVQLLDGYEVCRQRISMPMDVYAWACVCVEVCVLCAPKTRI